MAISTIIRFLLFHLQTAVITGKNRRLTVTYVFFVNLENMFFVGFVLIAKNCDILSC